MSYLQHKRPNLDVPPKTLWIGMLSLCRALPSFKVHRVTRLSVQRSRQRTSRRVSVPTLPAPSAVRRAITERSSCLLGVKRGDATNPQASVDSAEYIKRWNRPRYRCKGVRLACNEPQESLVSLVGSGG